MLTAYIQVHGDKAVRTRHDQAKQRYCLTTEDLICRICLRSVPCANTGCPGSCKPKVGHSLKGLQHQRAVEETLEKAPQVCTAIGTATQRAQQWVSSAEGEAPLAQEARRAAQLCNYAANFDSCTDLSNRSHWAVTTAHHGSQK